MPTLSRCFAILLGSVLILPGCSDAESEKELDRLDAEFKEYHASLRQASDAELKQKEELLEKEKKEFLAMWEQRFGTAVTPQVDPPNPPAIQKSIDESPRSMAALFDAINKNDFSTVEELLVSGVDVNGKNRDNVTPLVFAAALGHNKLVSLLLEAGAEVNKTSKTDMSPLHASVIAGHLEVVKTLLRNGANLEQASQRGVTPLFAAISVKNEDLALYLLDQGGNPQAKNAVGTTALELAQRLKLTRVIARISSKENESTASTSSDTSDSKEGDERSTPSDGSATDINYGNDTEYVNFPSAGLKLLRPQGFADAERFDGFLMEESQASVLVAMIPGPFKESTSELNATRMKSKEMLIKSRRTFEHNGQSAILLNVIQTVNDVEFEKWLLAFGDEKETRLITATFPKEKGSQLSNLLKSTVLSAQTELRLPVSTPSDSTAEKHPFSIESSGTLKRVENFSIAKGLCFTRDGRIPISSPQDPILVAVPSFNTTLPQNRKSYAVQRLLQAEDFRIDRLKLTSELEIDGLEGVEVIAIATDNQSGASLLVYQVMLFEDDAYILIQGLVGEGSSTTMLNEFKLMARSLKR